MYQQICKRSKSDQNKSQRTSPVPLYLKNQYKAVTGFSFDDVKIHYNSGRPIVLGARAYTYGNDIYIGPGQERCLLHELGHVVQQKMGIASTTTMRGGIPVNNDPKLEKAADHYGINFGDKEFISFQDTKSCVTVAQCCLLDENIYDTWDLGMSMSITREQAQESENSMGYLQIGEDIIKNIQSVLLAREEECGNTEEVLADVRNMLNDENVQIMLAKCKRFLPDSEKWLPLLICVQYFSQKQNENLADIICEIISDCHDSLGIELASKLESLLIQNNTSILLEYYGFIPYKKKSMIGEKYFRHMYREEQMATEEEIHEPQAGEARPPLEDIPVREPRNKLERINVGTREVCSPRKYSLEEKIQQYLRHVAAALKLKYSISGEIQCYYEEYNSKKIVYISGNLNCVNKKLREKNLDYLPVNTFMKLFYETYDRENRIESSKDKYLVRRLEHKIESPFGDDVILLIVSDEIGTGVEGLHAERRILYHLRSKRNEDNFFLDRQRLGGIRRPCFVCAVICFAKDAGVRGGAFWSSIAAKKTLSPKEDHLLFEAISDRRTVTYVTEDAKGNLTTDEDTESEAELSDEETTEAETESRWELDA